MGTIDEVKDILNLVDNIKSNNQCQVIVIESIKTKLLYDIKYVYKFPSNGIL